jgi:hypothetical protein
VWHTGTKSELLKNLPMGRNMVSRVPHEIATRLGLPDPNLFTFHSFRRTSATSAADGGSSTAQMTEFFSWKNASMCQEYVSLSKPAIKNMATKLAAHMDKFDMNDVEVEVAEESENNQKQERDDFMFKFEEDPENLRCGRTTPPTPYVPTSNILTSKPMDPEAAIKNVMSSVADIKGSNINIKVVVVTGNNGTMNF